MIDIKKNSKRRIKKGSSTPRFINILLGALVIFIFTSKLFNAPSEEVKVNFPNFVQMIEKEEIVKVVIEDESPYLLGELKDGSIVKSDNPNTESSRNTLFDTGVEVIQIKDSDGFFGGVSNFLWIGFVIILGIILFSSLKKGGGIGGSMFTEGIDTEAKKPNIKLDDVAGNEESKDSMNELIYYLKNPEKFEKYGIKPPKGAILYGPPGTGKTLIAKAVAGESDANFLAINGSDFVDKFVGNGASRVRHLFAEARKIKPCIIFIDEIDAVGGKRGPEGSSGNSERHQTLNALLSEMDGFSGEEGIVVLAATNMIDNLDDALLRSGRFDTKIYIGLPDLKARQAIFEVHSKNKPIDENVDFNTLAKMTTYFSGADIENVMNKAGFYAARKEKECIGMDEIHMAINHLIAGDEKKDRSGISDNDKKLTAYHEAGHAIIAKKMAGLSVPKITIIPTTHGAGGYTLIDSGEKSYKTKEDLLNQIAISVGGRAAEDIIFGSKYITTGASGDINKVTEVAANIVCKYGMSDLGMLSFDLNSPITKDIYAQMRAIVESVYSDTIAYLKENEELLHTLAGKLIEEETILEAEFSEIIDETNN